MGKKAPLKVVVTGGAGYIGSHVAKLLVKRGHEVLILDNLVGGNKNVPKYGKFIKLDFGDEERVYEIFRNFQPNIVMHFGAYIVVPESVRNPLKYYANNVGNTLKLLSAMYKAGVKFFIFSSSAAVYGIPEVIPVPEEAPLNPISPYGETKAMVEKILYHLSEAGQISYISLRYFNVAGADPEGELGPSYNQPTHLILRALKVATGKLPYLEIYGTDYPTPDGTCVRDFIHVMDLAEAHILAMEYLIETGKSEILNCGYGRGYSVKEVISTVKKVTGVDFKTIDAERRAGDPPILIADNQKIKKLLNFQPKYDNLEIMIRHAYAWEIKSN
ncbi:MAG: UDP-glucose 4-epimerase GalE [Caldimicrobium sp.]